MIIIREDWQNSTFTILPCEFIYVRIHKIDTNKQLFVKMKSCKNYLDYKFIVLLPLVFILLFVSIKNLNIDEVQEKLVFKSQVIKSTSNIKYGIDNFNSVNCSDLRLFNKSRNYPYVALTSFQGSGNTWTRHTAFGKFRILKYSIFGVILILDNNMTKVLHSFRKNNVIKFCNASFLMAVKIMAV